jgi:O-succinylbenzoic acid--CoA ligase
MTGSALFGWLETARRCEPQRAAYRSGDGQVGYASLYRELGRLAGRCLDAGLESGAPLALYGCSRLEIVRGAHLAMFLGCPLLPLESEHAATTAAACGIRQAFTRSGAAGVFGRELPAGWLTAPVPAALPAVAPRPLPSGAVQLLLATSGSTAAPRIVQHTGESLAAAIWASRRVTGLGAGDCWLNCLPLTHIGGFAILLRCLQAGATLLVEEGFDAAVIRERLAVQGVTHLSLVPAMLARLLEESAGSDPPATLRRVLVGGGVLSPELAREGLERGWPLFVTYGMTETASHVTCARVTRDWQHGYVGKAVAGARIDIVDARGRPTRGSGRVRIAGPMLMAGYAGGNRGGGLADGAFVSGDLGYLDATGGLHLAGRADECFDSAGYSIDPREIEAALSTCPGVTAAAVAGVPDPVWGHRVVAVVAGVAREPELRDWCRRHLASPLRPRCFLKVEALPHTALGKIDRPAVVRLAAERLQAERE